MSIGLLWRFTRMLAMDEPVPLLSKESPEMEVPEPTFTMARKDAQGRTVPQAIAHRGYKAAFPENTMGAFRGAVEVGAHAIETDIHLTKDGVVVLSHDADLKRCFGRDEKIIDCDWGYIKSLQTLKEPKQTMPRLLDLLDYLASPGLEHIWVLLDIKLDNKADDVMRLIASTISIAKQSRSWRERIVLGCWAAKYLPLSTRYLPGFPITHIGFSILYARQFLKVPNVSFNMLQSMMVGPIGARFLRDCRAQNRAVYLWTVNEEKWMRWSITRGVDGVITDDPKLYLAVRKDYDPSTPAGRGEGLTIKEFANMAWMFLLVMTFGLLFKVRYGYKIDLGKMQAEARAKRPLKAN